MSRIDEIKARCEAATEGPWNEFRDGKEWCIESDDHIVLTAGQDHGQGLVLIGQNDVDFIVNARGDLPWAVSEIERLTAALAQYREAEEDGPPCKIGDTVYGIRDFKGAKHVKSGVVGDMHYLKDMSLQIVIHHICRGKWGKKIFATRAEAEQAMKGESRDDR